MLLKFQIRRLETTISPGESPGVLTHGRLFLDAEALEVDIDTIVGRAMPALEEWLCEHGEEIVAAFPGRHWCVHIDYDKLIGVARIDLTHDITKREDMARWN